MPDWVEEDVVILVSLLKISNHFIAYDAYILLQSFCASSLLFSFILLFSFLAARTLDPIRINFPAYVYLWLVALDFQDTHSQVPLQIQGFVNIIASLLSQLKNNLKSHIYIYVQDPHKVHHLGLSTLRFILWLSMT